MLLLALLQASVFAQLEFSPPTSTLAFTDGAANLTFKIRPLSATAGNMTVYLEAYGIVFDSCVVNIPANTSTWAVVSFRPIPVLEVAAVPTANIPVKLLVDSSSTQCSAMPEAQTYTMARTYVTAGVCTATGDPHITTFDKIYYDGPLLSVGTYYLFKHPNLEVQIFTEKWSDVSVTAAVAYRIGNQVSIIDMRNKTNPNIKTLWQNGVQLSGAGTSELANSGRFSTILVPIGGGTVLQLNPNQASPSNYFDITLTLGYGYETQQGLCNQIQPAIAGKLYDASGLATDVDSSRHPLKATVDSWRVADADSMFSGLYVPPTAQAPIGIYNTCAISKDAVKQTCNAREAALAAAQKAAADLIKAAADKAESDRILAAQLAAKLQAEKDAKDAQDACDARQAVLDANLAAAKKLLADNAILEAAALLAQQAAAAEHQCNEARAKAASDAKIAADALKVIADQVLEAQANQLKADNDAADAKRQADQCQKTANEQLKPVIAPPTPICSTEQPVPLLTVPVIPTEPLLVLPQSTDFSAAAVKFCNDIFNNTGCQSKIIPGGYIQSCVADTLQSGNYVFAKSALTAYLARCKTLTDYQVLSVEPELRALAVDVQKQAGLGANVCMNSCSAHGSCGHYGCTCDQAWGGADCSISLTKIVSYNPSTKSYTQGGVYTSLPPQQPYVAPLVKASPINNVPSEYAPTNVIKNQPDAMPVSITSSASVISLQSTLVFISVLLFIV